MAREGELLPPGGDGLPQLLGLGQELALAGEDGLSLPPELRCLPFPLGDGLPGLLRPVLVLRQPPVDGRELAGEVLHALPQGGEHLIEALLHALEPQHLVLCGPLLGLGGAELILGGVQLPAGALLRRLGLPEPGVQGLRPAPELLQLRRPAEDARAAADGAAGHGAAPVDDLAVQRHDAEGAAVLPGHGDAAVQVLRDDRPAQKVLKDVGIPGVKAHQAGGDAHKAELRLHAPLPELVAPDGGEGQEGGSAPVPALQEGDGALGVLLPVHHDVLQSRPQGDLNGQGVLPLGLHQVRHRSVDAPEPALLLADQLHGLMEALVVLLHLREEPDTVVVGSHLHGELHLLLGQRGGLLPPLLHPEGMSLYDIGGGGGLVLGVLQGSPVGLGLPGLFREPLLRRLPVRLGGGAAIGEGLVLRQDGGLLGPRVGGSGHGLGLPGPEGFRLLGGAAGLLRGGLGLRQDGLQLSVQLLRPLAKGLLLGVLLLRLGFIAPAAAQGVAELRLQPPDVLPQVVDAALPRGGGGVLLGGLGIQLRRLGPEALGLHVLGLHLLPQALILREEGVHPGLGLVPLLLGGPQVRLQLPGGGFQVLQIREPDGDLQQPQLIPQDEVALGLLRLRSQRLHLELQLRDLVVDAQEVFLRALQLALGLLLAVAVLGDARRLLKDLPPVAALGGEDLVDPPLADDGVALLAHAGVQEELRHVLQPDGLAVDVVLALAAAVVAPGHGHLGLLHGGEDVGAVVDDQRHLGKARLGPLGGAAEDDVLHLGAPEALGALLAHDPADGVRDVGLAGAVGSHDGGDVLAEVQRGLIGERFESLNGQTF